MRFKKLNQELEEKIELEIKSLLHASRDCLRNQGKDSSTITFIHSDGYLSEAFGMLRTLEVFGHGYFGSDNLPDKEMPNRNLKWWFNCLKEQVLEEENWGTTNECDHCVNKWGKDGAGRTRDTLKG